MYLSECESLKENIPLSLRINIIFKKTTYYFTIKMIQKLKYEIWFSE